ncbi:helix-turn-helix domain-containing protein [Enterobacter hormaechei]|uniref:helix-turn-helix domain-containing protein n=1 Tax=Enterobacter hormaechei TaxID=158836 RepID=UPI0015D48092|nr:helix-turn-helix transcriptional regulator [Enterobacter hormaechei]MBM7013333.1 helix-turn-helix transcriptional regulator [Enterobacter cloacae]HCM9642570.1 helix-turn-helix transcriptional regulator [Enterobacter hormaechei subsp. xiangfangensis]MCM7739963.1 helix-turn-helix domain-containing protein [Enterobacter hormaechei]HCA5753480.1 helix-turn-helix transcriptional regulator [Enterobacter hormaechei]HCA6693162.1 helix-turn-helix transcriptional regulator [Enterobacter hormaechei]
MNFGKRLQKAIKDLEISQSELARRLGVKAQSVNGWCNSDILPRSEILNLLPAATGYPLSWFFMEDGETHEEHDPWAPKPQVKPSTELQERLLEAFEQLPTDDEKERIIKMIDLRLEELDNFAKTYLQKRNLIPPTK